MLNASLIAESLTNRYGVAVTGEASDEAGGQRSRIRPTGLAPTRGFTIEVLIGWRTVEAEFLPDNYAAQLLTAMSTSTPQQRVVFSTFISSSIAHGAKVTFRVNGQDVSPLETLSWPTQWRSLSLAMHKGPFDINGADGSELHALALAWSGRMLGSVLSLLELEQIPSAGEAEGAPYLQLVKRYERSEINRAACIEIHGCCCKVCGFDFEKVYGEMGIGFIEVHHLELVSGLAPDTIVDPGRDLAPVCANCHAMAHRRTPPFTIEDVRAAMIAASKGSDIA